MLDDEIRARLHDAFAENGLEELTLQQTQRIAARTETSLRLVEWAALDYGIVPRRYQRHMGCFGLDGQKRLLESTAIIIGLGGLGGHVLEQLARVGVGRITGVDPDVFDETNLNRQLLSEAASLGRKKVDEAAIRLKGVNGAVEFSGHAVALEQLPTEALADADVAVDCLDTFEARLLLAQRCSAAGIPLVHGAIAGWCGEACVVWPNAGTLENIYRRDGRGTEQGLGNPSFTAAAAASLMAALAVKVLTGKIETGARQMLFFDLLENEWQPISENAGGRG